MSLLISFYQYLYVLIPCDVINCAPIRTVLPCKTSAECLRAKMKSLWRHSWSVSSAPWALTRFIAERSHKRNLLKREGFPLQIEDIGFQRFILARGYRILTKEIIVWIQEFASKLLKLASGSTIGWAVAWLQLRKWRPHLSREFPRIILISI